MHHRPNDRAGQAGSCSTAVERGGQQQGRVGTPAPTGGCSSFGRAWFGPNRLRPGQRAREWQRTRRAWPGQSIVLDKGSDLGLDCGRRVGHRAHVAVSVALLLAQGIEPRLCSVHRGGKRACRSRRRPRQRLRKLGIRRRSGTRIGRSTQALGQRRLCEARVGRANTGQDGGGQTIDAKPCVGEAPVAARAHFCHPIESRQQRGNGGEHRQDFDQRRPKASQRHALLASADRNGTELRHVGVTLESSRWGRWGGGSRSERSTRHGADNANPPSGFWSPGRQDVAATLRRITEHRKALHRRSIQPGQGRLCSERLTIKDGRMQVPNRTSFSLSIDSGQAADEIGIEAPVGLLHDRFQGRAFRMARTTLQRTARDPSGLHAGARPAGAGLLDQRSGAALDGADLRVRPAALTLQRGRVRGCDAAMHAAPAATARRSAS